MLARAGEARRALAQLRGAVDDRDVHRAAAAAAVLGAAATAGKLGWDHRHREPAADLSRDPRFGLLADEDVGDGVRRVARGRLDAAIEHIERGYEDEAGRPTPAGIHDARKDVKRLRATVRLARDAIGAERARSENAALRDAARRLADARDSTVLLERLEALRERFGHELAGSDLHGLDAALRIERDRAAERLRNDPHNVGVFVEQLRQARERVAGWDLADGGYDAVAPGLRRIYRRGRRAFKAAAAEPSVEALHEWRKRVKDLRHAAEILRDREPSTLRPVVKRSKRLADLLGEDHDLALLRERALPTPALVGVIDRRRGELQQAALRLGAKLYRRKPQAFVDRAIARHAGQTIA